MIMAGLIGLVLAQLDFRLPQGQGVADSVLSDGSNTIGVVYRDSRDPSAPSVRRTDDLYLFRVDRDGIVETSVQRLGERRVVGIGQDGSVVSIDVRRERARFPWGAFSVTGDFVWSRWKIHQGLYAGFVNGSFAIWNSIDNRVTVIPWEGRSTEPGFIGDEIWLPSYDRAEGCMLVSLRHDGTEIGRRRLQWTDGSRILNPLGAASMVPLDGNRAVIFGKREQLAGDDVWHILNDTIPEAPGQGSMSSTYLGIVQRGSDKVLPIGVVRRGYPPFHPINDPLLPRKVAPIWGGNAIVVLYEDHLYVRPVPPAGSATGRLPARRR